VTRTCVVCGATFRGRAGAKYCNGRCRQKAYRLRQAAEAGSGKCNVTDDGLAGDPVVLRPKVARFSGSVGLVIAWDRGQGWREVV
jgi:hypothetical protein